MLGDIVDNIVNVYLQVRPQLAVLLVLANVGRDHHDNGHAVDDDDGDDVIEGS